MKVGLVATACLAATAPVLADEIEPVCWKDTYDRGVGRPIHTCADGLEQDGLLCYPLCKDGYYGVGPVCWQSCDDGYTDMGVFCDIPLKIISADNSACPWYDVCGLTLAPGCSTCPDDPEPPTPGWINDGCTCRRPEKSYTKDSYGRGAGVPLGCSDDEDEDAGLCYDKCPDGFDGVGPVCWEQCSSTFDHDVDGGALCCRSQSDCTDEILKLSLSLPIDVMKAILKGDDPAQIIKDVKAMIDDLLGFVMPICSEIPVDNSDSSSSAASDGACQDDADQLIWQQQGAGNFTADMDNCGHKCYGAEQCVTDCVKDAEGYSDECSACFGALADCTVKQCMAECMLGRSDKCDACVAENCNPGFTDCSGISDIPS